MKIRRTLVALLLPLVALVVAMAKPAVAAPAKVSLSGTLTLHDDETWPIADQHYVLPISGSWTLTPAAPTKVVFFDRCRGGEVRGQLEVRLRLNLNNTLTVTPVLRLYEDVSCPATDLDGVKVGTAQTLGLGQTRSWTLTANTVEFASSDYARAAFSVTHSA